MSNTVSSVVWPWREGAAKKADASKGQNSKKAAVIQTAVMAVIGAFLFWRLGHRTMGFVVWSFSGVVLVSGLFIPPVFSAIERFGKRLGQRVGEVLTWVLLTPFYYLCFFPMHLALKLKGKDPLHRQIHTAEPTYWTSRKPVGDVSRYRKQF